MARVQSVIFDRMMWTEDEAELFLDGYNFHPIKAVHVSPRYLRYRIQEPNSNRYYFTDSVMDEEGNEQGVKFVTFHNP